MVFQRLNAFLQFVDPVVGDDLAAVDFSALDREILDDFDDSRALRGYFRGELMLRAVDASVGINDFRSQAMMNPVNFGIQIIMLGAQLIDFEVQKPDISF